MFTEQDFLFVYNLLHWGGIILLIVAVSFACYQINPKLFNKNPQLIFLPGLVVAGLLYAVGQVEKMQERQEAAAEEAEWRQRYEPAKARFDQLCRNAGEKIYRTAEDVDGILLLKVRGDDEKYQDSFYNPRKDQMWEDAAIESESKREEYVASFLPYYSSVHYDNVDVLQKDGSIIRYSGNWSRYAKPFDQETNPRHPARYAVTYENDVSWENRKHWIAGTTIKVIDTKTDELMAEKTMYVFVPALGYSKLEQNPNPWGRGDRCPEENSYELRASTFVKKVLISPAFKPEARQ
ncbi:MULTISPECIES: hypothetical protein [Eikenella]|uniref:Uncharacterized protein n=1 Tax=Eikenella longinqua TaxID=1795827 RepID=A0A1A9S3J5_9NEIS|nr:MULTISPECIES: hypothetical protein [Eikenella]OAM31526.1 hypothetical protein A7P95_00415 [Eikenella longinqua]